MFSCVKKVGTNIITILVINRPKMNRKPTRKMPKLPMETSWFS